MMTMNKEEKNGKSRKSHHYIPGQKRHGIKPINLEQGWMGDKEKATVPRTVFQYKP